MEKIKKMSLSMLTLILMLSMLANIPNAVEVASPTQGPRTEDLIISFYSDAESAYAALKAGEIDLMALPLSTELFGDAVADANIVVAPVAMNDIFEFDFNNNDTIPTHPGIRSPMSYLAFRRALAHLVDKDYIVEVICEGFAARIDQPISYSHRGWRNQSYWYEDGTYPYEYDPVQAAAVLDAAGFPQGTTPNPYYDPDFPNSAEYIRSYPVYHPQKPGEDLDPIIFCARTDRLAMLYAGRHLYENMRKHGIFVDVLEADKSTLYPKVMGERDYHIYTGHRAVERYPTYLYNLFHSDFWFPYGSNYVAPPGKYPDLDVALEKFWYAPSYQEAQLSAKKAQGILVEKAVSVWLYSYTGYQAYSNLCGVVNMHGYGLINRYTFLNAYRTDEPGAAIRIGQEVPVALNPLYSIFSSDWQVLNLIYGGPLSLAPYALETSQPWFFQDWEIGSFIDPFTNETKGKITFGIRKDITWIETITGTILDSLTSTDILNTILYTYWWPDSPAWKYIKDIIGFYVPTDQVIDLRFNATVASVAPIIIWFLEHVLVPIVVGGLTYLGLKQLDPETTPHVHEETTKLDWPLRIIRLPEGTSGIDHVYLNGLYLDKSAYELWRPPDDPKKVELWIYGKKAGLPGGIIPEGTDIKVDYKKRKESSPHGYFFGGYPWQEALIGYGPYYVIDFVAGVGGHMALKANRHFFLETPLLGEVDFVRKPDGYYKIDIFDVVIAASAYGSQGTGVPSSNWFAGADVAPLGGKIDIYDIVTIIGKYGTEWGHPPP